jgi:hypothetical protein
MAEGSGSNAFLGFVVGGLVVAVVAIGYIVFGGNFGGGGSAKGPTINIEAPKAPTKG